MTKEGYDLQKISFYKSGFTKNCLAFQINKAYVKLLQKKKFRYTFFDLNFEYIHIY